MGGEAHEGVGADHVPGRCRRQVVLAHVDAVRAQGGSQVGPVVEHEGDPFAPADLLDERGPSHQGDVVEVLLAQLHHVDPAGDAPADEHVQVGAVRGAQVEATPAEVPAVGPAPGDRHPGLGSLARASALAACLNWRTLASASAESMSATDRKEPASP